MAAELCDACNSPVKALFRIRLSSGGELAFCGHHLVLFVDKLVDEGAFIYRISEP